MCSGAARLKGDWGGSVSYQSAAPRRVQNVFGKQQLCQRHSCPLPPASPQPPPPSTVCCAQASAEALSAVSADAAILKLLNEWLEVRVLGEVSALWRKSYFWSEALESRQKRKP